MSRALAVACAALLLALAPSGVLAQRAHFDPPAFVSIEAELTAPPELAVPVDLSLTFTLAELDALDATLDVAAPSGMKVLSPGLPHRLRLAAGQPTQLRLRLVAQRPIGQGAVCVAVRAPYPTDAVKSYFLKRVPLYAASAQEEFARFMERPPKTLDARAGVTFSASPQEARLGAGRPTAVYLRRPAYALVPVECGSAGGRTWTELVAALQSHRLTDLRDWCRLYAMGLAKLGAGAASAAAVLFRQMLAETERTPAASRYSRQLECALATALAVSGRGAEARPLWERLARQEASPHAAYNLGLSLETAGELRSAKQWYSEAVRLSPGYTLARRRLKKLATGSLDSKEPPALSSPRDSAPPERAPRQ